MGRKLKRISDAERQVITQSFRAGQSFSEIGSLVGRSRDTVRRALAHWGLHKPKPAIVVPPPTLEKIEVACAKFRPHKTRMPSVSASLTRMLLGGQQPPGHRRPSKAAEAAGGE